MKELTNQQRLINSYPWLKELSEEDRNDAIRRINICKAIGAAVPDKLIHDRYKKS